MLTGILNKPINITKGQDNFITLDRDLLWADVISNKDSYFHQLSRWTQVLVTYKTEGEQINHLEFDPRDGAFPIASFNPSSTARDVWQVQTVMIRDLDNGEVLYCRDELDVSHFDITIVPVVIAPTITFASISSTNVDPSIAVTGDTITVSFQGSEPLINISATIAGQSATPAGSGTNWSANYVVTGSEPDGVVSFSIDYQNASAVSGVTLTATTDGSSVTIDNSTIPNVSLSQLIHNSTATLIQGQSNYVAQTFEVPEISILNNITLKLAKSGIPTSTLTLSLYEAVSLDSQNGVSLATQIGIATKDSSTLQTTAFDETFVFNSIELDPLKVYYFELENGGPSDNLISITAAYNNSNVITGRMFSFPNPVDANSDLYFILT